jgi:hypothetical protein
MGQAQEKLDVKSLALLKKDTRIFESIIEEVLKQHFDNPFAIAGEPKATYLKDYGVSVSFHLKINRGTIRTFYGEVKSPLIGKRRTKEQQLETVRETMEEALADYGGTLKQIQAEERIAICAHIEDRNELDSAKSRTVIVLSVPKQAVDSYTMRKIGLDQFREQVEVLKY